MEGEWKMSWGIMVMPERVMVPGENVFERSRGGPSLTATVPEGMCLLAISFEDVTDKNSAEEVVAERQQTEETLALETNALWERSGEDVWKHMIEAIETSL